RTAARSAPRRRRSRAWPALRDAHHSWQRPRARRRLEPQHLGGRRETRLESTDARPPRVVLPGHAPAPLECAHAREVREPREAPLPRPFSHRKPRICVDTRLRLEGRERSYARGGETRSNLLAEDIAKACRGVRREWIDRPTDDPTINARRLRDTGRST